MRARSILPITVLAFGLILLSSPVHATGPTVERHSVIATDIVLYVCDVTGEPTNNPSRSRSSSTMPTGATTGEQMTIGWRGTYADGSGLIAPAAGLAGGTKLYAYASISDLPGVTSATGVGELGTVGADEIIPLPTTVVDMRTTANNAGTASVKPAAINFGTSPPSRRSSARRERRHADDLPLPVTAADQTTSPSPSPSPTDQPPPPVRQPHHQPDADPTPSRTPEEARRPETTTRPDSGGRSRHRRRRRDRPDARTAPADRLAAHHRRPAGPAAAPPHLPSRLPPRRPSARHEPPIDPPRVPAHQPCHPGARRRIAATGRPRAPRPAVTRPS